MGSLLPLSKVKMRIVTKKFWQQVSDDIEEDCSFKFEENKQFEQGIADFEKGYKNAKQNRLLRVRPNLGAVKLTLHFDQGVSA